jgi:F-type H+-transporting ATPase subunit delta
MSQAMTLARPYARAAFSVAREAGALSAWSSALAFAAHVAANSEVAALLGNPKLTHADVITLLAPEGADEALTTMLGLLFENGRLSLLPEITGLFDELRRESERVIKATVTSAAVLVDTELDTIKTGLRRRFGCDVEVETAIDESLIGGAIIDVGDVVIDGSLKGKLSRLQAALAH